MVIRIFFAVCGLSLLFFAVFFVQCCRLASRKSKLVVRKLPTTEGFSPAEATRLFAQLENEMAEFMARQGRSTALLFLLAASFLPVTPPAFVVNPSGIVDCKARLDDL